MLSLANQRAPPPKRATLTSGHKSRISTYRQLPPTVDTVPSQSVSPTNFFPLHQINTIAEMSNVQQTGKKQRSAIQDVVSREYTINLHKRVC